MSIKCLNHDFAKLLPDINLHTSCAGNDGDSVGGSHAPPDCLFQIEAAEKNLQTNF